MTAQEDPEKWSDLAARAGSAGVMLIIGTVGLWYGSHTFNVIVSVIAGLMVWELARMIAPRHRPLALQLGGLAAIAALLSIYLPPGFALPLLLAPALIGFGQLAQYRATFLVFAGLVLLASFGMMSVRSDFGFWWMLWLVLVVVATDVAGYFAGRMLGGPKFWPRVSPKKTWSGTIGGWVGAALVGAGFAMFKGVSAEVIGISVAVSMASQIGDIGESAIKRRMGVKDSSHLIPGHGGVLDRFDGMLGASIFLLLVGQIIGFPPGQM